MNNLFNPKPYFNSFILCDTSSQNCTCKATLKEANSKIEAVEKEYKVEDLAHYLSEYGLIYYRTLVEVKWLLKLSQIPQVSEVPSFSNESQKKLQELIDGFSNGDARQVKNIERITNHDVKAVEYFLKTKCQEDPQIAKVLEFFHFGCTSEDINNLAHGLMLKESLNLVILPGMAKANAHIPMLSRTHGQPASPTTLGKEMVIFAERLSRERHDISKSRNFGEICKSIAYIVSKTTLFVTQIESHDYMAKLFHSFIRFNNILLDFDKDIWGYISVGYFKHWWNRLCLTKSTQYIDFENSEGNLGIANAILDHLSMKLPISRWQVNEAALNKDLDNSWEVLAEPIQTVMRRYGV
ncbi:unnamed protein product [Lactuca virosa]|uniref:Adenylosuccinate lyase n=1 Tax=Lactuca virosa TaxID=75947 RepID=A0AAU9PHA7_9ASTR|nr:unnamed protein product [Lactuca virosa]